MGTEHQPQTREASGLTHEFRRRLTTALNDNHRIRNKWVELLRDGARQVLKAVFLQQGNSGTLCKLVLDLSSYKPAADKDDVTMWLRNGWSNNEKSVLNDARAAGVFGPLLFRGLPCSHHEEPKQAIASQIAAQETLDAHDITGGPETIKPRKAVEARLAVAQHRIQDLLRNLIGSVKFLRCGGHEANGIVLADKVQESATSAPVNHRRWTYANLWKLTCAYPGGWIRRQQAAFDAGESGSDALMLAAKNLHAALKLIIEGKTPFDLFTRCKPLPQQVIGWQPNQIDGEDMNIRPFMARDIPDSNMGAGVLRASPTSRGAKIAARKPYVPRPSTPGPGAVKGQRRTSPVSPKIQAVIAGMNVVTAMPPSAASTNANRCQSGRTHAGRKIASI